LGSYKSPFVFPWSLHPRMDMVTSHRSLDSSRLIPAQTYSAIREMLDGSNQREFLA